MNFSKPLECEAHSKRGKFILAARYFEHILFTLNWIYQYLIKLGFLIRISFLISISFKILISAFDQNVIRHLIDIGMTAKRHADITLVINKL